MNDEFEKIWKEPVVTQSRYCPIQKNWREPRSTWVRIADVPFEIRTEYFPGVERYLYTNLLGFILFVLMLFTYVSVISVACSTVAMQRSRDGRLEHPFLGNGSVNTYSR
jgi:hypothetical protein